MRRWPRRSARCWGRWAGLSGYGNDYGVPVRLRSGYGIDRVPCDHLPMITLSR